jgi:hypothetical protein
VRADRDDDELVFPVQRSQVPDRFSQANFAAAGTHVFRGWLGEKPRKIDARQEQVRGVSFARQRVAQGSEKDVGGRLVERRVERRDA